MVEMKWQDPPAALTMHESVLRELKRNAGRWALVAEGRSSSSAGAVWAKDGCETKVHRNTDGPKPKYDVYARWPERQANAAAAAPPPRPAGPGTYNPADRARRGIPVDGLPVTALRGAAQ